MEDIYLNSKMYIGKRVQESENEKKKEIFFSSMILMVKVRHWRPSKSNITSII